MLPRLLTPALINALQTAPAVALLGPRQVGKTTLALDIAKTGIGKASTYLDLELDTDLAKLEDAEGFLRRFDNQLLVIDEVQRRPDLFRILRGLIDLRKRAGEKSAQFLLLGSASRDLLQQSSESLAGRIRYLELAPFSAAEIHAIDPLGFAPEKLWFRGGFPLSFLAGSDQQSWDWRSDFIAAYIERDIPQLGSRIPAARMRRFWTMLAHLHGQQVNLSTVGKSLEVSHTTVKTYLDLLADLYMVRQIPPWAGNTRKRLVKTPRSYIRDTGLLHRLLGISRYDDLLGHPVAGPSWEGFIVENIIGNLSDKWRYSYYRSAAGVEIDLVLEQSRRNVWAIEIKRNAAPKTKAAFHAAAAAVGATKKFVIHSGKDRYPLADRTEAIGIAEFLQVLHEENRDRSST